MKAKTPNKDLSDYIRQELSYCPESGLIKWNHQPLKGRRRGKYCGQIRNDGYVKFSLKVNGKEHSFVAHRVAWFLYYGDWPDKEIDHINQVKSDNRLSNLRLATRSQNMCHTNTRSNNKSGFKGISFKKDCNKWESKIMLDGKYYYLGLFKTPEDAHEAYCIAAKKLHGDFHSIQ